MAAILRMNGIVLRSIRHGETSLILTAITREAGKIGLMAKGARAKSRYGSSGGLDVLNEIEALYYFKAGRDLQLLKEWSVISPHSGLRNSFDSWTVGTAITELLSRCLLDDDPHPNIYDDAASALAALDMRPIAPICILWALELRVFRSLGFGFRFERCAATSKLLTPPYRAAIRYRLHDGSFLHSEASASEPSEGELSSETFALLTSLSSASFEFAGRIKVAPHTQSEVMTFLSRYLETHLSVRGKLRSLDALQWTKSYSPNRTSVS